MANQKEDTKGDRHFPSGLDSIEAGRRMWGLPHIATTQSVHHWLRMFLSFRFHRSLRVFKGIHHIRHVSSFSWSCALFGFMKALGQEPAHGTGGLYRNLPQPPNPRISAETARLAGMIGWVFVIPLGCPKPNDLLTSIALSHLTIRDYLWLFLAAGLQHFDACLVETWGTLLDTPLGMSLAESTETLRTKRRAYMSR